MAKRKYTREEVRKWQEEHNQTIFYSNKDDSNLFATRRSGGMTLNLAHPASWVIIAVLVGLIVTVILRKQIFG